MSLIPHSSASSSSSRTYEICLVCEANYGTRDYRYEVFVVDVGPCSGGDHGLRVLRNPLFRIPDAYATMGFFAVDSSIYFLGGFRLGEPDPSLRISNNVYVYDTSSSDSAIKKLSCMNYGKLLPVIIGPLNEKFYAISKYLSFHDFEVFDPKLDSWSCLCQPPVSDSPENDFDYAIDSYAVVNEDREILMWTSFGLYSYHIDSDNWYFYAKAASIPFVYDRRPTGCTVSIGGDRCLGFTHCCDFRDPNLGFIHPKCDDGHIVLGTYRHNSSDHTWHDFHQICDWPEKEKVECRAYPMSLGDGLVCAVVAGYDPGYDQIVPAPAPAPAYDDDPHLPSTHIISIGVFVDGPKFNPLYTHQYKDDHNMKYCKRTLVASFPLNRR
ncbi:uncharacterized protein LOC120002077 [Tripterygium wilfordii]|uniref:uncharacterized protein LOC120002077 n=1 Tax=Tripterygium wilfordii TaxID=458696 RepID=UPI0018F839F2|nr:uncharacterized protein LOC120002077 [Tripterygium wilfordii]